MTENQVQVATERFARDVPSSAMPTLRSKLQSADETCMDALMGIKLKSRTAAILLSVFLGGIGAGRFYLGDKGIGIARIVVTVIINILVAFLPLWAAGLLTAASFIWIVVEIFLVAKKVRWTNYETLSQFLNYHTKR